MTGQRPRLSQSLAVEYAPSVLDRIRTTVIERFERPGSGAAETAGVLFGAHSRRQVTVTAMRTVSCGYSSGSAFVLEAGDYDEFEKTVGLHRSDPALAGLEPVGWFVSHVSDSLVLRPSDKAVFDRYFPLGWQLVLVIRPGRIGALRAATIGRGEEPGEDTVLNEFSIKQAPEPDLELPDGGSKLEAEPPPHLPDPLAPTAQFRMARERRHIYTAPEPFPAPPPAPEAPPLPERPALTAQFRMGRERRRPDTPLPEPVIPEPSPLGRAPDWPSAPWRLLHRSHAGWILAAIAVLVSGSAALLYSSLRSPSNIALQAIERDGIMQIEWNPHSRPVTHASSARLEIVDGDVTTVKELTRNDLKLGRFATLRKHLDLTARLRLFDASGGTQEEMTQYAGRPLANRDPVQRTVEELRSENSELRRQLSRERQRASELERRQKNQKGGRRARKTAAQ